MPIKIKAILFDLVGTLIYVKDSVGTVYSNIALSFGFNLDPSLLDKTFSIILHSRKPAIGGDKNEKQWWREVVFDTFKESGYNLGNKFDDIFEFLFLEFTKKNVWAVYQEVFDVFKEIQKRNISLGLISNFDSRLEVILQELNLFNYFNSLSYSGKVGFSKPDIKIFKYSLQELNILPEESMYIGDSLYSDYYPACGININALLIDRKNECQEKDIKKIASLNEIFNYV